MFYVMDGTSDETCARILSLPWFTIWCNMAFYSGILVMVSGLICNVYNLTAACRCHYWGLCSCFCFCFCVC
jgi:hypothetical protein